MTERALPLADGASACPFVAFEDDRDERASVPDHRHRCYAELRPAPRAIAHQEAYCLSSAFPVCPTFQDWARREAARARGGGAPAASPGSGAAVAGAGADVAGARADVEEPDALPTAGAGADIEEADAVPAAGPDSDAAEVAPVDDGEDEPPFTREPARPGSDPDPVRRNPPRDWSAPPPWLASTEGPVGDGDAEPPAFVGRRTEPGQGLAGSAADRMAGGSPPSHRGAPPERWAADDVAEDVGLAGLAAAPPPRASRAAPPTAAEAGHEDLEGEPVRRVSRRPRAYDQHLGGTDGGPDWERPRRYEAYPTIRTRVGMPQVPRLAVMAGVIVLLAIALFFLPGLLNFGGTGGGAPAASSSARPAGSVASLAPTVRPAPTPIVYTLKKGDTLSKIATKNGLTIEELLAANPDIKNPNKIAEGQQITIPTPSDAPPDSFGGSAEPSAAP